MSGMITQKINSGFVWKGGHPYLRWFLKDEQESNEQAEGEHLGQKEK